MKPKIKISKFLIFLQGLAARTKDNLIPLEKRRGNKQKLILVLISFLVLAVVMVVLKFALIKTESEYFLPVELSEEMSREIEQRIAKNFEILKITPQNYDVYMDLGNLERERGRASIAIKYFKKAWEIIPANSTPWLNIGNIYIKLGLYNKAEEAFLKAKDVNPSYHFVYFNLAKLYTDFLKEKSSQVRAVYLEGLKNTANDYELLQHFTSYLIEIKNYSEALEYLEVLLQKVPQENKQALIDRRAEVKKLLEPMAP